MVKKFILLVFLTVSAISGYSLDPDGRKQWCETLSNAIRESSVVKIDSCLTNRILNHIFNETDLLDRDTISVAVTSDKYGESHHIAVTLMSGDTIWEIRAFEKVDSCDDKTWEIEKQIRWDLKIICADLVYPTDLWLFYLKQWHTSIPNFIIKGVVSAYPDLNYVGFRILKNDLGSYVYEQFPITIGGDADKSDWYLEIVKIIKQYYELRRKDVYKEGHNDPIEESYLFDIDFSTLSFSAEEMKKLFTRDHLTVIIDSTIYGVYIRIGNENWVKIFYAEPKFKKKIKEDSLIEVRFINPYAKSNFKKKENYEHYIKFGNGLLMDTMFDYYLYYQEESIPGTIMRNVEAEQLSNDSLGNKTVYQIKRCSDGRLKTTTLTFSIFQGE